VIAQPLIGLAVPDDAPQIAAMSRGLIEQGLPWRWRPERVAQAIMAKGTNVAVVREQGELIAFGIMEYHDDDAHLVLFAVRRDRQRQGLGSALLRWLEAVARIAGSQRIRLESLRSNEAARIFYNEHGYHERVIRSRMYSGVADGILLEKYLRVEGEDDGEDEA